MRPDTLFELAAAAGMTVRDPRVFESFADFQRSFQESFEVTQASPQNLRRLVREIVADAATDGVVWVQPHFDPHAYTGLGSPEHVMSLVLEEGQSVGADLGIGFGLTMSAARHRGPEVAEDLARFAARYAGEGVCAFGLAGNEAAYPPEPFAKAFAIAREAGLTAAPHAGELGGPDSVRAAVEILGASRIAHGIAAVDDPDVLSLLVEQDVSLDVCLTSNLFLLEAVSSMSEHPLPRLIAAGGRCSLDADDPMMFAVGLLDEHEIARTELAFTDDQLAELARTSIETATLPDQ